MKEIFYSHYRPNDVEFSELWEHCIFILDTNTLLNLYRLPEAARNDFFRILIKISDRLWIPHQVALEYQKARISVISDQAKKFDEVIKVITETEKSLVGRLEELQLKKRHSSIDPDAMLEKAGEAFAEFLEKTKKLKEKQPDVSDYDELREQIDSLFEGKIGPTPKSQADLDEIYADGERRYEIDWPPGYMDKEKKGSHIYNGMVFERKYGDLILWKQIINEAKREDHPKKLVFVTTDIKEDWWWMEAGKTIGPRPELIEEITSEAGVESFYMYNMERFMEFAEEYIGVKLEKTSLEEVKATADLYDEARELLSMAFDQPFDYLDQYERVYNWILSKHHDPNEKVRKVNGDLDICDFLVINEEDKTTIGYDIKAVDDNSPRTRYIVREKVRLGESLISIGELKEFNLVIMIDERKLNLILWWREYLKQFRGKDNVHIILWMALPPDQEGSIHRVPLS